MISIYTGDIYRFLVILGCENSFLNFSKNIPPPVKFKKFPIFCGEFDCFSVYRLAHMIKYNIWNFQKLLITRTYLKMNFKVKLCFF